MTDIGVGVALIVKRDSRVLVQRRLTSCGHGHWGFPGGHLEKWESFQAAALRELREEAGSKLQVTEPKLWTVANCFHPEIDRHYVVIFLVSDYLGGEAIYAEPTKAGPWYWRTWDQIPEPRMPGIQDLFFRGLNPWEM